MKKALKTVFMILIIAALFVSCSDEVSQTRLNANVNGKGSVKLSLRSQKTKGLKNNFDICNPDLYIWTYVSTYTDLNGVSTFIDETTITDGTGLGDGIEDLEYGKYQFAFYAYTSDSDLTTPAGKHLAFFGEAYPEEVVISDVYSEVDVEVEVSYVDNGGTGNLYVEYGKIVPFGTTDTNYTFVKSIEIFDKDGNPITFTTDADYATATDQEAGIYDAVIVHDSFGVRYQQVDSVFVHSNVDNVVTGTFEHRLLKKFHVYFKDAEILDKKGVSKTSVTDFNPAYISGTNLDITTNSDIYTFEDVLTIFTSYSDFDRAGFKFLGWFTTTTSLTSATLGDDQTTLDGYVGEKIFVKDEADADKTFIETFCPTTYTDVDADDCWGEITLYARWAIKTGKVNVIITTGTNIHLYDVSCYEETSTHTDMTVYAVKNAGIKDFKNILDKNIYNKDKDKTKLVLAGFYDADDNLVISAEGNLLKNFAPYTDALGRWIYPEKELELWAKWSQANNK